jgi:hypothetical protein
MRLIEPVQEFLSDHFQLLFAPGIEVSFVHFGLPIDEHPFAQSLACSRAVFFDALCRKVLFLGSEH